MLHAVVLYVNVCVCVSCRKREAEGAGPGQHCGEPFTLSKSVLLIREGVGGGGGGGILTPT